MNLNYTFKMLLWILGTVAFNAFVLSLSFVHIHTIDKETIKLNAVIFVCSFGVIISLLDIFNEPSTGLWNVNLRKGLYSSFEHSVMQFGVAVIAYVFGWVPFIEIYRILPYALLFGGIYFFLQGYGWKNIKRHFSNENMEYTLSQIFHIIIASIYAYLCYKLVSGIFYIKDSLSPWYYIFIAFLSYCTFDRLYECYKGYLKHNGVTPQKRELNKKKKELDRARSAVTKSDRFLQKLQQNKLDYQAKIESKIIENPECEEAKIEKIMAEIDKLDSRITIGESVKSNLTQRVRDLELQYQELEVAVPLPADAVVATRRVVQNVNENNIVEIQVQIDILTAQREVLEQQLVILREGRIIADYAIASLTRIITTIVEMEIGFRADVRLLRNTDVVVDVHLINNSIQNIQNELTALTRRVGDIIQNNAAIEFGGHVREIIHESATKDIQQIIQDTIVERKVHICPGCGFQHMGPHDWCNNDGIGCDDKASSAGEIADESGVEIDDENIPVCHMGTDGYPICPNCQCEHNFENGHDLAPYCSASCFGESLRRNNKDEDERNGD